MFTICQNPQLLKYSKTYITYTTTLEEADNYLSASSFLASVMKREGIYITICLNH